MPDHSSRKGYRVYRGGHVRKDDPDAARFAFGQASAAAVKERPATPAGMPRPGAPASPPPPQLPGRQVATAPPGGRRFRIGWKRGILLGLGVFVLLFGFWLYLGYRSFSDEVAKANKRLDKRTKAALAPAGNILARRR